MTTVTVSSGVTSTVSSGVTNDYIVNSGGTLVVGGGGVVSGTVTVSSGGSATVNGTVSGLFTLTKSGSATVGSGGLLLSADVQFNQLTVVSGGVTSNVTLEVYSFEEVDTGSAVNTTISAGGMVLGILGSASATNTTISATGIQYVGYYSGTATATNTTIFNGTQYVGSGSATRSTPLLATVHNTWVIIQELLAPPSAPRSSAPDINMSAMLAEQGPRAIRLYRAAAFSISQQTGALALPTTRSFLVVAPKSFTVRDKQSTRSSAVAVSRPFLPAVSPQLPPFSAVARSSSSTGLSILG